MNPGILDRLHRRIAERRLLDHPFYRDWSSGKLTIDDLRLYAGQYYHFEATFPRLLSAVHSRCPDPAVRQGILSNLWDEEHGEYNHRELWLGFSKALGMATEEATETPAISGTQELLETYVDICGNRSFVEGLAAIYAYEVQIPEVAAVKMAGLRDLYHLTGDAALAFFQLHSTLDVEHSRIEGEAIARHTSDDVEEGTVESALQAALDAWWGFLDGVNELRAESEKRELRTIHGG